MRKLYDTWRRLNVLNRKSPEGLEACKSKYDIVDPDFDDDFLFNYCMDVNEPYRGHDTGVTGNKLPSGYDGSLIAQEKHRLESLERNKGKTKSDGYLNALLKGYIR